MSKPACCLFLIGLLMLLQGGAVFGFDRDQDPNLIGYWSLDEGTGTVAYDLSGKGNNGTLSCTATGTLPLWTAGVFGGAVQFNGSNNYIDVGNAPIFDLTSQVTLAAWVYPSRAAATGHECYITKGDATYTLKEASANGSVQLNIYNAGWHTATLTGRTAANNNTWYHLAGTFDGSNLKIFLNGVLAGTTAWTGTIATNTASVNIGRDQDGNGRRYYQGRMDDVRIYSRALTDAEVSNLLLNAHASNPSPVSGATDVDREGRTLSWTAGEGAVKHDVYLGTDAGAVSGAAKGSPLMVGAGQTSATFKLARLELGATYYWRVDETTAAGIVTPGYLWQFTVEPVTNQLAASSITATASASDAVAGIINTVNSSGLTGDLHGTDIKTMWASGVTAEPVWVQYTFDRVYKMSQMLVWNYNGEYESMLGFGLKDVTIQASSDGVNFTNVGDFVFAQGDSAPDYKYNTTVDLGGVAAKALKLLVKSNYGGPQYGLSEVRFFYTRAQATVPNPASGTTGVSPNVTISWRAGRGAVSHNVYLGTDPNVLTLAGASKTASYTFTGLNLATTYYWSVEEVNMAEASPKIPSDVWNFTTIGYWVVDDMEGYNTTMFNRIFDVWADGWDEPSINGSMAGLDTADSGTFGSRTIVHGGTQSLPLSFTNVDGVINSQIVRTFKPVQNWTTYGPKFLTLYFYGQATNKTTIPLWVKVTDQAGKSSPKVAFGSRSGEYASALSDPAWTAWSIPLSSFSGIDLKTVNTIRIGVGDGKGSGTLYVDDLQLTAADAEPVYVAPALAGWWKLDNDVTDSSGNGNNGTLGGAPVYVEAGRIGASLKFNGTSDYVDCGTGASLNITDQVTLAAWIKPTDVTASGYHDIVGKGDQAYALRVYTSQVQFYFYYSAGWHQFNSPTYTTAFNGAWHHVAGTYDGLQAKIYVDGALVTTGTYTGGLASATAAVSIGRNTTSSGRWYSGELDDVRVYRGVLPSSEIRKLANP